MHGQQNIEIYFLHATLYILNIGNLPYFTLSLKFILPNVIPLIQPAQNSRNIFRTVELT